MKKYLSIILSLVLILGTVFAVPVTSETILKPVATDMTTLDTSVSTLSTKTFDGVTYQIYWYGGITGARNTFNFAKK